MLQYPGSSTHLSRLADKKEFSLSKTYKDFTLALCPTKVCNLICFMLNIVSSDLPISCSQ